MSQVVVASARPHGTKDAAGDSGLHRRVWSNVDEKRDARSVSGLEVVAMEHLLNTSAEAQIGPEGLAVADTAMHAEPGERILEKLARENVCPADDKVAKIGMLVAAVQKKIAAWDSPRKSSEERIGECS